MLAPAPVPADPVADAISYIARPSTSNTKVGPGVVAVSRGQATCPVTCPLWGRGCYGQVKPGRPSIFEMVAKSLAGTTRHLTLAQLAVRRWRKPPVGARFGVVGDWLAPDGSQRPDTAYMAEASALAKSLRDRFGTRSWSYTHAWRLPGITPDMAPGVMVRASVESPADAATAIAAGWRVAMVDPGPSAPDTAIGSRISGQRVVQCPATTGATVKGRKVTCSDCLLCAKDAAVVVAFPVHGAKRGAAAAAVRSVRSLPVL